MMAGHGATALSRQGQWVTITRTDERENEGKRSGLLHPCHNMQTHPCYPTTEKHRRAAPRQTWMEYTCRVRGMCGTWNKSVHAVTDRSTLKGNGSRNEKVLGLRRQDLSLSQGHTGRQRRHKCLSKHDGVLVSELCNGVTSREQTEVLKQWGVGRAHRLR